MALSNIRECKANSTHGLQQPRGQPHTKNPTGTAIRNFLISPFNVDLYPVLADWPCINVGPKHYTERNSNSYAGLAFLPFHINHRKSFVHTQVLYYEGGQSASDCGWSTLYYYTGLGKSQGQEDRCAEGYSILSHPRKLSNINEKCFQHIWWSLSAA
jgi:hypothetical protein